MDQQLLEPIQEETSFKRDVQTGAVVNVNHRALDQYKRKKERNRKIQDLEEEIEHIKGDIGEIKNMLYGLVNR